MLLTTPFHLGPVTLPSRLVFAAHLTLYAEDGLPTARHAAYYAERAAGGAGLVIAEEHATDPHDRPYEKVIEGWNPAALPGMRAITEAVHAHGVPVLAQLTHNGGQSSGRYTERPVRGPSPVPDPMFREVPVELTRTEIAQVVAGYVATAGRCVEAGYDGVEIQAAHSSLVRQFLSPLTNRRTDEYGADRARLLLEITRAVRETIGSGRVVGVRICGDEGLPGGVSLAEAVAVARRVEPWVDYLNTAIGVTSTLHLVEPSMHVPRTYAQHIPAALRAAVRVPVIGIGRFGGRAQAEQALADGICDLVGAVRAQIADPTFGRGRTCLACNQECVGRTGRNRWLGCLVNPRAGREAAPLPAPVPSRRVLVVGGGPGGLSAAVEAAGLGHRVVLCDRAATTGGALRLAAALPGRGELGALVADLHRECRAAGVEIRTGVAVDAAYVAAERPDVVVLATGARPATRLEHPATDAPDARVPALADVRDVVAGHVAPTGSVLVVDELGFHPATGVAELLATAGCQVEITTSAMIVGQDLGRTLDMENFHRRATALAITMTTDRVVLGVDGPVRLLHHPTGVEEERVVDWVVFAGPPTPEDGLWRALRGGPVPVHRVGDCLAPRRAHAAVLEGRRAAHAV